MAETSGTKSAVRSHGGRRVRVGAGTDYRLGTGARQFARGHRERPCAGGRPWRDVKRAWAWRCQRTAAKVGALLAWLATVASGGWVLARWLLAGGRLRRGTATAAPPSVILAHVGGGAAGLVLWVVFMLTGWVPLAWIALGMLAPVAGLGMGVLLIGLPRPVAGRVGSRAAGGCRSSRSPRTGCSW